MCVCVGFVMSGFCMSVFLMCVFMCGFCNMWVCMCTFCDVCLCMFGFLNASFFVCVGFVMFAYIYIYRVSLGGMGQTSGGFSLC